jgi:hypothetical protein
MLRKSTAGLSDLVQNSRPVMAALVLNKRCEVILRILVGSASSLQLPRRRSAVQPPNPNAAGVEPVE